MLKNCNKCKEDKVWSDFYLRKGKPRSYCKECTLKSNKSYNKENHKAKCKEYYIKNKDKLLNKQKEYNINNKDKINEYHDQYRKDNADYLKEYRVDYYEQNKESIKAKVKKYRSNNLDKIKENNKKFYNDNKEEITRKNREYYQKNKSKIIKKNIESEKRRLLTDPSFKLRKRVSKSIARYINGSKDGSCLNHLPFSIAELKNHLEDNFDEWMNWDNYGPYIKDKWDNEDQNTWKWNLDHIIPHSEFKYSSMKDESFKKCWSLNNLRPLSAKQNVLDGTRRTRHEIK